jgi:hypothetical protein
MKKKLLILLLNLFCLFLNAQYVENKLNIGFGVSLCKPLNRSLINKEYFSYPSLYGNFKYGYCAHLSVDYKIKQNFWIGIEAGKTFYTKWSGDQEIFVLKDPYISLTSVCLNIFYCPKHYQIYSGSIVWGVLFAPIVASQNLEWSSIKQQKDESNLYPYSEIKLFPGLKTGFGVIILNSNGLQIRSDICYQYFYCDNYYYTDKAFHSINISLQCYFRFKKNRYFRYE